MITEYFYDLPGLPLKVTIGKVAEQANGAALIQSGDTTVLVTAVAAKEPREGIDFFPLTCEYEEKMYAMGKFPGGFIKREGKSSEHATLTARQIDRPLRPLFPDDYRNEVQVIATVLSVDEDHEPEILAMIGSSIALTISDIPFQGPTGSVSVGFIDGEIIINPNREEREKSQLDLTVAGTKDAIMMVEAGCNELDESQVLDSILKAHDEIKGLCEFIISIREEIGKEKSSYPSFAIDEEIDRAVKAFARDKVCSSLMTIDKMERQDKLDKVKEESLDHFSEIYPDQEDQISAVLEEIERDEVRRMILEDGLRPDNRQLDEIRPLSCEVDVLPRVHGSAIFKRGQTQVLSVTTLGGPGDAQTIDGLVPESYDKRYIHHYNFPPYCVGDIRPLRSPGRREIGHGALAERALKPMIPSEDDFPYTIRVVSEVLSSNGSSSMASVCGSTMSLMAAGVPIKKPVAGIAMGLIKDETNDKVAILTDIQGLEDHLGDMDFKVAGTNDGITAVQMDIKISGIDRKILTEALDKAKKARLTILDKIHETIKEPRKETSPYAPRVLTIKIHPDKVREVIGPGGKVINNIIDECGGVTIDTQDDGQITVTSSDGPSGEKAIQMIEDIVHDPQPGEVYEGKVSRIMKFGAFVDLGNNKEGMIHISQIANERIGKVEDVLNIGDQVRVKVTEIDDKGRINLSRKALLGKENKGSNKRKED